MYVAILLIIGGAILCGYCLHKLRVAYLCYYWPSVKAQLYHKEVNYQPSIPNADIRDLDSVIITYKYKVNEQEYFAKVHLYSQGNSEQGLPLFPSAPNEAMVYYNPNRPSENVPESERSSSRILLGFLMVVFSAVIILAGITLQFPGVVTRAVSPEPDWREVKRAVIAAREAHPPTIALPAVSDDYKYTQDVKTLAEKGYTLFKEGKFMTSHNSGHHTDTDPQTLGFDFWSNGKMVKVDRDHNGHFETIFMIKGDALVYVGSIGGKGVYVDVGEGFEPYLGHYSDEPF